MMESVKRQGTESARERERVLFEVGEVKSALARSLNATEIFWSEWLHFIHNSKLFEQFPCCLLFLSHTQQISSI